MKEKRGLLEMVDATMTGDARAQQISFDRAARFAWREQKIARYTILLG